MQDSENGELVKIKISHLIRFAESFVGVEIHLFINGKFVKMNYANDQFVEILRKLQQKDVEEIYLRNNDCSAVIDHIQHALANKTFYDPKTTTEERVETLDNSQEVAKTIITKIGVSKETIEVMRSVNQKAVNMLAESPSIFNFIKSFRKNCSEQFMISIVTGYLTSLVIDKFPWKTIQVKEKAGLASLLCDITLQKDDFAKLKDHYKTGAELEERIKNHPREVVTLLGKKKELIPSEVITIIEQHHELPDGRGFPGGIDLARFNQLSTIFIVCQRFTEMLFTENFDYTKREDILRNLNSIYTGRNFEKALGALTSVVE